MRCLIVGNGIAGTVLMHQLKQRNCEVEMIATATPKASQHAAGILNPTVLKRYTAVWKAQEFHAFAISFYRKLEDRLGTPLWTPLPIHRIFSSLTEQNDWAVAAGQPHLLPFIRPQMETASNNIPECPFGYGVVEKVGRLNVTAFLRAGRALLGTAFHDAIFDYDALDFKEGKPQYKQTLYDHIFFCEGFDAHKNPFFNTNSLTGNKGEMLCIESKQLSKTTIWKGPVFICPLGERQFWVGASFHPSDKEPTPTKKGKEWLEAQLHKMGVQDYTITAHHSGIRPTVLDRRPLLGTHPTHQKLHLLNGLGTRGVLMAPLLAEWLCAAVFDKQPLDDTVNWLRFAQLESN
jgi:glycine oxidase